MNPRQKITNLLLLIITMGVVVGIVASPRVAQGQGVTAVTGGPVIINIIVDIPKKLADALDKATKKVETAAKAANDVAYKSALQLFENRLYQEVQNQLTAAGNGQKPLFLTNPLTFFKNVGESAAGDYIDQYVKAYTGGAGFEGNYSTAQAKFILSRYLRTQANLQVTGATNQCTDGCDGSYLFNQTVDFQPVDYSDLAADDYQSMITKGDAGFANAHDYRVYIMSYNIYGPSGTDALAKKDPNSQVHCTDVTVSGTADTETYTITIGKNYTPAYPTTTVAASDCLKAQTQALLNEQQTATSEDLQCRKNCQTEGAAVTQGINSATQTDVTTSLQNADPAHAPAAIANALADDKSDLGQLITASGALTATVQEKITGEQTNLNPNTLPKTTAVSREVTTPSAAVSSLFGVPITTDKSADTYTGTSLADVLKGITSFINSPIGKAIIGYYKSKCGMNPSACKGPSNATSAIGQLVFGNGAPTGVAGAALAYAALGQSQIIVGNPGMNDIQVTEELSTAGLIDTQFRAAIDDLETVQQAITNHNLDPQKTFGFDKSGIQPTNGYSYRAFQYLRKYRIIPVGWELAAEYSQQFDHRDLSLGYLIGQYDICGQDTAHKVCSRGTKSGQSCQVDLDCGVDTNGAVIICGASPYCGLVDPNWVLKAPQTFCRRQGAGEEIITKQFVCDTNNVDATTGKTIPLGQTCATDGTSVCTDIAAPNCTKDEKSNLYPDMGHWVVSRNTDTCADTQSCISENADGTCLAYGYCVQERSDFKFNGTQCSAENSSCASFTDPAGQLVGYLTNTLDSQNCTADNAGCTKYCAAPSYDPSTQKCNGTDAINFNAKVQTCDASQVGCSQYLSLANGANMIANGGFETFDQPLDSAYSANFSGWKKGNVCSTDPTRICSAAGDCGGGTCLTTIGAYPVSSTDATVTANNTAAVRLTGGKNDNLSQIIHTGYDLYERTFTFSMRAKADTSCSATMILETAETSATRPRVPGVSTPDATNIDVTTAWASYSVVLSLPSSDLVTLSNYDLRAAVRLGGCAANNLVVDSAQLEESSVASTYKEYGSTGAVYLNGQRQSCTAADVGCQAYTPVAGGAAIDGQVRNSNRCSPDSVGCTTLQLERTTNIPIRTGGPVNAVVPKGQLCTAAEVGCEEYTNLDVVAQGGEGKEYYSTIRQCVKPSQINGVNPIQATYYTWVGDATLGYVLRSYDLVKTVTTDGTVNGDAPCTSLSVGSISSNPVCNDTAGTIAAAEKSCSSASDLTTNADCTQFYDSALNIYYRLRSHTISITNDCTPYRNSIDQSSGVAAIQDRVYYVSTNESVSCSSTGAGCRAYTGNASGTTRKVLSDDFETTGVSNWIGGQLSDAATSVNGHSMLVPVTGTSVAAVTGAGVLNNQLKSGRTYTLTFSAAAASATSGNISAAFGTLSGSAFTATAAWTKFPGSVEATWNANITPAGPEWHTFVLGPIKLIQDYPTTQLGLTVSGGSVYIDNVTLTEVYDHLYMINTSLPMCTDAEVGCAAYKDGSGAMNYLTSFARLCSEQVVGCQALVNTQNSTSPFTQTVKGVTTPADTIETLINNPANYCPATAKGCGVFGKPTNGPDQTIVSYQSTYLINNPDRYSSDICEDNELSCNVFTTSNGTAAYFKDPGQNVCDYRTVSGGGGWYITGTSQPCPTVTPPVAGRPIGASCSPACGSGSRQGKTCTTNADCPGSTTGNQCVGNGATIGKVVDASGDVVVGQCATSASCASACVGGAMEGTLCNRNADCGAGSTCQRNSCLYLAGSCPTDQNSCTEYRDPTDPLNCRSNCALTSLHGSSPDLLDETCQVTKCADGARKGQNCQNDDNCFDGVNHQCVGGNNQPTTGIPGCRSYFFMSDSLESSSSTCNGTVNVANGCLPFNNTTNPSLNFVGQ